jgi:hypothetical protein
MQTNLTNRFERTNLILQLERERKKQRHKNARDYFSMPAVEIGTNLFLCIKSCSPSGTIVVDILLLGVHMLSLFQYLYQFSQSENIAELSIRASTAIEQPQHIKHAYTRRQSIFSIPVHLSSLFELLNKLPIVSSPVKHNIRHSWILNHLL